MMLRSSSHRSPMHVRLSSKALETDYVSFNANAGSIRLCRRSGWSTDSFSMVSATLSALHLAESLGNIFALQPLSCEFEEQKCNTKYSCCKSSRQPNTNLRQCGVVLQLFSLFYCQLRCVFESFLRTFVRVCHIVVVTVKNSSD